MSFDPLEICTGKHKLDPIIRHKTSTQKLIAEAALLVNASNAFNFAFSAFDAFLHNAEVVCLLIARYIRNCYTTVIISPIHPLVEKFATK